MFKCFLTNSPSHAQHEFIGIKTAEKYLWIHQTYVPAESELNFTVHEPNLDDNNNNNLLVTLFSCRK